MTTDILEPQGAGRRSGVTGTRGGGEREEDGRARERKKQGRERGRKNKKWRKRKENGEEEGNIDLVRNMLLINGNWNKMKRANDEKTKSNEFRNERHENTLAREVTTERETE